MKLLITDKNGSVKCTFKGSAEDAIFAIANLMGQESLIEKIMKLAVKTYELAGDEIKENVDETSIVRKHKTQKPAK